MAAALAAAAASQAVSCGGSGGGGSVKGAQRAACYPACVANLVKRCPLVTSCGVELEPDPAIARPGESMGVATCFASGERLRLATDITDHSVIYVKAADGTDCYAAAGNDSPDVEIWDISAGGQLVASLSWDLHSGAVSVTCDGVTMQVDTTQPLCQALPWQNTVGCNEVTDCSFGGVPAPALRDAGPPPPTCDAACTSPPATSCGYDSVSDRAVLVSYASPGTCHLDGPCTYAMSQTSCTDGCYNAQCTGPLGPVTNVAGKFTYNGASYSAILTDGSAPANTPVTITVRTMPRGAAHYIQIEYGTHTASTLPSLTNLVVMTLDPATPADQSDYEQWTADIPAMPAGTGVAFDVAAHEYGGGLKISQASPGVNWGYTAN